MYLMKETPQIVESYNRDGFVAIPSFFIPEKLEEIKFLTDSLLLGMMQGFLMNLKYLQM